MDKGMNGRISPDSWARMDTDERLWIIYDTLNSRCANHWLECDKRITGLENRKKIDTTLSALAGVFGGFIAMVGRWMVWR